MFREEFIDAMPLALLLFCLCHAARKCEIQKCEFTHAVSGYFLCWLLEEPSVLDSTLLTDFIALSDLVHFPLSIRDFNWYSYKKGFSFVIFRCFAGDCRCKL